MTISTWSEFYEKVPGTAEYEENVSVHAEFLGRIKEGAPKSILEVGCGSGTLSIYLSASAQRTVAVDNNDAVLANAVMANRDLSGKVSFIKADAFGLPFGDKEFDAAFSQGVLEHFSDEDIRKILGEQVRVAKNVFFSVPSRFYNHRDFGNERLLTRRSWERILKGFDVFMSEYYYRIRTKRNFLLKLPIMYMAGIR